MKKALGKGRLLKDMQKTIILDANAILRYILDDIKEQADIVQEILLNEEVLILPEVIAEVVYVMHKIYKIPREYSKQQGYEVFTFDKDLNKLISTA